jgi:hypothetical protein
VDEEGGTKDGEGTDGEERAGLLGRNVGRPDGRGGRVGVVEEEARDVGGFVVEVEGDGRTEPARSEGAAPVEVLSVLDTAASLLAEVEDECQLMYSVSERSSPLAWSWTRCSTSLVRVAKSRQQLSRVQMKKGVAAGEVLSPVKRSRCSGVTDAEINFEGASEFRCADYYRKCLVPSGPTETALRARGTPQAGMMLAWETTQSQRLIDEFIDANPGC